MFYGPRPTGWAICLVALFSIYCEFLALLAIERTLSGKRDIFWILRIPIGMVSACIFIAGTYFCLFFGLPGLIFGDIPALLAELRRF
jgi:hypothetical protein